MPASAQRAFLHLSGLSAFLLHALFAASLAVGSAPAAAQVALPLSPALACLTLLGDGAKVPDYPEAALARKEGGTLRVRLEFGGPEKAPKATIVSRPMLGHFDDTVLDHVKRLRVPCMQPGDAPVNLTQDYVFDAVQQSRVIAGPLRDNADPVRQAQLKCMVHGQGAARPQYPREALQRNEWGTLIVRMRFSAPDAAPAVEVVQSLASPSLNRAVMAHVAGMRMPCLGPQPVATLMAFKYIIDGGERIVLKDMSLLDALAGAQDLKTPAKFDFRTMACPFDLRVSYFQPYAPNRVEQLDSNVPERGPFMEWMRGLTLKLPGRTSANLFGDRFVVSVPCTALDL